MNQLDLTPRPPKTALTAASGFLDRYTHTLQPFIGCRFACEYCYVKGSPVHLFHQPRLPWGDYVHPRVGIAERLEQELKWFAAKGRLDELAIFMSSATDPYQGLERRWRLSRACLEVMTQYPPGLVIVQTRSPFVQDDYPLLRRLGDRSWLNLTIETDLDSVRQAVAPRSPSIPQRLAALQAALAMDLNVQVVVSPCLPFSDVETFGALLLAHSRRVIVDTFTSGDGSGGQRTAKTDTPAIYTAQGWGDWRDEQAARVLYQWLQEHMGERVGWSQAGFTALAKQVKRARA